MIDGIKTGPLNIPTEELRGNPLLTFYDRVNTRDGDGEILPGAVSSRYKGMRFKIWGNGSSMFGSLHVYFNQGNHNANDFYYSNLLATLEDLKQRFNIGPETILGNVEFGINLSLPIHPEIFLNSLIIHRGKRFQDMNPPEWVKIPQEWQGVECIKDEFIIKIYNKGLQFKRPDNLLRIEIKAVKMRYFKTKGISIQTLGDLTKIENLRKLGEVLVSTIEECLFCDPSINGGKFTDKERLILSNGLRPKYWEELKTSSGDTKAKRKQSKIYDKNLARFKTLVSKNEGNKYQLLACDLIRKKWDSLLNDSDGTQTQKGERFTAHPKQAGENFTIYSVNLPPHPSEGRICPVTGLDISMQKKDSIFLNIAGIESYKENEPEIYRQLEKRLSKNWINASLRIRMREIAHSIRNEFNNPRNDPRNNNKRAILKVINSGPVLWDSMPYIDKGKRQISGL